MPIAVIASAGDSAVFLGGAGVTDARPDVREFASGWPGRNSLIVVGPPAAHGAVAHQGAGVPTACADLLVGQPGGERGHLANTELRVIFGQPEEVLALFGKSIAYIERTHLTMRLFNGRLVRHTLGFSKDVGLYLASAAWEDAIYNLVRPLKTLRLAIPDVPGCRWKPRSPAMAAGLTDHLWTVKELLTTIVLLNT